jgi:hypothetical protein
VKGNPKQPRIGWSHRLAMRDIRSDWRHWSPAERLGAVAIGAVWLGTVSPLLVISAG